MSKKLDKLREDARTSPWPKRLKRMKRHQEENSKDWQRNARLLFGKSTMPSAAKYKHNSLAYAWGLVKSLKTLIYVQNPDMIADARNDGNQTSADTLTKAVLYDIDQMDVKGLGNLCLIDNFVYGYGALVENVETIRGGYSDEADVEAQNYELRRVHPKDILFDPQGLKIDLSDHRYVAMAWYPTVGSLLDDKDFAKNLPDETALKRFPECSQSLRIAQMNHTEYSGGQSMYSGGEEEKDLDYKTICVWEIHDKVAGEVLYVTDYQELEIGRVESPLRLKIGCRKLFPVTLMALNLTTDGFYPVPELSLVSDQLDTLNIIDAMMRQDTVTKWRKYAAPASLLSQEQAATLTDPDSANSLIRIDDDEINRLLGNDGVKNLDMKRLIAQLEDVSMARDLPVAKEIIEQDISKILGYGPIDRGGLPKTRSAREAMAIKEKMDQRLVERADIVAEFYRLLSIKHIQFMQQTLRVERYARVVPDIGKLAEWISYSAADLDVGEFDFIVYAGTSGPQTTEAKRASEVQLFQTAAPIVQQMGGDLRPLFYRLAKYHQWNDVDSIFKNPKGAAKMLAMALAGLQTGQADAVQALEAASAAVMQWLTPEELKAVSQALRGQGQAPAPGARNIPGTRGDQNPMGTIAGAM